MLTAAATQSLTADAAGVCVICPTPFTPNGALDERSAASMTEAYVAAGASGLVNAALLRAVERGAKVVYDWALLRSGDGMELELETTWPVILPDVLPGVMPTTASLPILPGHPF